MSSAPPTETGRDGPGRQEGPKPRRGRCETEKGGESEEDGGNGIVERADVGFGGEDDEGRGIEGKADRQAAEDKVSPSRVQKRQRRAWEAGRGEIRETHRKGRR